MRFATQPIEEFTPGAARDADRPDGAPTSWSASRPTTRTGTSTRRPRRCRTGSTRGLKRKILHDNAARHLLAPARRTRARAARDPRRRRGGRARARPDDRRATLGDDRRSSSSAPATASCTRCVDRCIHQGGPLSRGRLPGRSTATGRASTAEEDGRAIAQVPVARLRVRRRDRLRAVRRAPACAPRARARGRRPRAGRGMTCTLRTAGRHGPLTFRAGVRDRHTYPCRRNGRGGQRRAAPADRRPDHPQLRRDARPVQRGRRRHRARSCASTRTRSSSTSATRARGSSPPTSSRSASPPTRRTRSSWARRSTRWSSPRRIRTAA